MPKSKSKSKSKSGGPMMSKKNLQMMGGVAGALLIIVIILVVLFWLDIIPGGSTPPLPPLPSNPNSAPPIRRKVNAKCYKYHYEGKNRRCAEYNNQETIAENGDILVPIPPDEGPNMRNPIRVPAEESLPYKRCSMGSGKMDSDCGWVSATKDDGSEDSWKSTCCHANSGGSGNGLCGECDPTKPGGRFPIYRKPGDPGWKA